jgi:hypothetical protein
LVWLWLWFGFGLVWLWFGFGLAWLWFGLVWLGVFLRVFLSILNVLIFLNLVAVYSQAGGLWVKIKNTPLWILRKH